MSRLLTARTEMVPLLVSALILFAAPLVSCANDQGNQGYVDKGATSDSANANPKDGVPVQEVASSPAGGSDDTGGQGELSGRADQNPVGALPSGGSGSPEEAPGGEAGASEYAAGANPVAQLPKRVTPAPAGCEDCPYYFDADGDGIGAGESAGYESGKEPLGWVPWVPSYPDNCPDVYNPAVDQYGIGQPDSDGDGVGDACDSGTPDQYSDTSDQ